jgi:hypothetical protein
MIDTQSTNNILFYGGGLTLVILFASLAIFGWLAVKYRNIRDFQFQIFVFIIIYIIGEILENYKIPSLSASLPYLGSQIHIIAAAFLALALLLRLYHVRSSGRKTVDKLESVTEGDVGDANDQ